VRHATLLNALYQVFTNEVETSSDPRGSGQRSALGFGVHGMNGRLYPGGDFAGSCKIGKLRGDSGHTNRMDARAASSGGGTPPAPFIHLRGLV